MNQEAVSSGAKYDIAITKLNALFACLTLPWGTDSPSLHNYIPMVATAQRTNSFMLCSLQGTWTSLLKYLVLRARIRLFLLATQVHVLQHDGSD